jgi:hypothetical protein
MEMMLWNVVLSAIVGVMVFMLKGKFDELQRISILLNKTREHFDSGFERLEKKIDALAARR